MMTEADKNTTITVADGERIKVGDTITIDIPIRRKWWQLHKPRYRWERKPFLVTWSNGTVIDLTKNDPQAARFTLHRAPKPPLAVRFWVFVIRLGLVAAGVAVMAWEGARQPSPGVGLIVGAGFLMAAALTTLERDRS